jgi:DNA (cytosine-5)-methyltransferase 3A
MNVLSLFDGMSCGQQALERAGIKVDKYFASEIDKYAIQVTMANYPDTIQLGSVVDVKGSDLPKIDLLIGGSPCQSFSFAGKRKGMSTKDSQDILTLNHYLRLKDEGFEFEGQSYLFWEYMRLLNEVKPTYFLLENVMMSQKWKEVLTGAIGIDPIMINSALLSAQNRKRLYWTNIGAVKEGLFGELKCGIQQPEDRGILLKDVLEPEVDPKYYVSVETNRRLKQLTGAHDDLDEGTMLDCYNQSIHTEKSVTLSTRTDAGVHTHIVHSLQRRSPDRPSLKDNKNAGGAGPLSRADGKTYCLDTINCQAVEIVGCDYRTDEGFRDRKNGKSGTLAARAREDESCGQLVREVRQLNQSGESNNGTQPYQQNRVYDTDGISPALCKDKSDLMINSSRIRKLTPVECERLQTVNDNYTAHVSNAQRYKMLGNGWTISVIEWIFNYLPKEFKN